MNVQIEAFANGMCVGYHHDHFTGPWEDGRWGGLLQEVTAEAGDFLRCDFRTSDQHNGICQLVEPGWEVEAPTSLRQTPIILVILDGRAKLAPHNATLHPGDWVYLPPEKHCLLVSVDSGRKPAVSYGWCELSR